MSPGEPPYASVCTACAVAFQPGRGFCPACGGEKLSRVPVGSGVVVAVTELHVVPIASPVDTMPYRIVLVRADGFNDLTVMAASAEAPAIGDRVHLRAADRERGPVIATTGADPGLPSNCGGQAGR